MSTKPATSSAFSPTTMLALILVSLLCVTGLALLSSFEPELKSGNDGAAHALSKSSVGYSGMVSLTRGLNYDVSVTRYELDEDDDPAILILTPPVSTDYDLIESYVHAGPTILILPKWAAQRDPKRSGWANLRGTLAPSLIKDMIPVAWRDFPFAVQQQEKAQTVALAYTSAITQKVDDLGTSLLIKNPQTIKGPSWETIVPGPNGGAFIAKLADKDIYVVADPDFFNNSGLAKLDQARLLDHFLTDIAVDGNAVAFDLTFNGFQRQPNLTRLALEPPLLGVTLCILLAGILIGFQAATRFLPPKPAVRALSLGKSALAANTAALIRMGKREPRMAIPYANLIRRQVMKTIGIPPMEDKEALNQSLDRAGALTKNKTRFSDLMKRAEEVGNTENLIKVADSLHQWKQEMTRERQ